MTINLDKRVDLAKKSVGVVLTKAEQSGIDLGVVDAQVALAVDYSGSMARLYDNGSVQSVVESCLALSLTGLDNDESVPVYPFHHDVLSLRENATPSTYKGFVQREFANKRMGGTNYSPVIEAIVADTCGVKIESPSTPAPGGRSRIFRRGGAGGGTSEVARIPAQIPTLVLFVTDGQPEDPAVTRSLMVAAAGLPIFWQFVGIGVKPALLDELDTMGGRLLDNVGFSEFDPYRKDDEAYVEEWFTGALEEFMLKWIPAARKEGVIP